MIEYPINYKKWVLSVRSALNNQCNENISNAVISLLYENSIHLNKSEITIDMGFISPQIFSCKLTSVDGKKAYIIESHLHKVPTLVLYLEPNLTLCPRYHAFILSLKYH